MSQAQLSRTWRKRVAILGLGIGLIGVTPSLAERPSLRQTTTVLAIQRAEPAVVNIEGNKPASSPNSMGETTQVNGMGAGVIIDPRGYILTNQHVIQDVTRIEVTLHSGQEYIGQLIARDPQTDLALIKISSRNPFPVIDCGTSSDLMRGEPVIAIGNPFGYHHTVTEGIISALHRDVPVNGVQEYPDLIQTDASINPGNSGGPLLNADGLMIGINAAVRIGAQGIGFAIPIDRACDIAADMIAQHRASRFTSPLSVKTEFLDGKSQVRVVSASTPDFHKGDLIVTLGDRGVATRLDFELALVDYKVGSQIPVNVERDGSSVETKLVVGEISRVPASLASATSVKEKTLQRLGLRLELANADDVRRVDADYPGGLRVTSVRRGSPADLAEILPGDVLVTLHDYTASSWRDLDWILTNKVQVANATKFRIMRRNAVYEGLIKLEK